MLHRSELASRSLVVAAVALPICFRLKGAFALLLDASSALLMNHHCCNAFTALLFAFVCAACLAPFLPQRLFVRRTWTINSNASPPPWRLCCASMSHEPWRLCNISVLYSGPKSLASLSRLDEFQHAWFLTARNIDSLCMLFRLRQIRIVSESKATCVTLHSDLCNHAAS